MKSLIDALFYNIMFQPQRDKVQTIIIHSILNGITLPFFFLEFCQIHITEQTLQLKSQSIANIIFLCFFEIVVVVNF